MLDIIILIIFAVRRSRKAKAKGYTGWHWGLASVLAFLTGEFLVSVFVFRYTYGGHPPTLDSILRDSTADPGKFLVSQLLATMGGIGGALFVKWRLDNMPDKNEQDRQDWLDRLGDRDR